jgi:AraC-like DNA-binding protein
MMTPRRPPVLQKHATTRGILDPEARHRNLSGLTRYHASADLAPFVQHYWIVRWDLEGKPSRLQETLPHPSVHLALERNRSAVFGVVKGRFSRLLEGKGCVFGVAFRPGGFYPFVRSPVSRLTNRTVPVSDLFDVDGATLEAAIFAESDEHGMVLVAEEFLRRQSPHRDPAAEAIGGIVEQTATDRTITTVDTMAQRSGYSVRSLQRLFSRYIGVGPKWVINRYRLHEVVDRLAGGETIDWTRLALELGYFDQAHFIRDFKAIVGRTPGDYRNR